MFRRMPLLVFAIAFLSITVSFQDTQAARQMSKKEILEALKPGLWVEMEGIGQRDLTVLCSKVKFLTGDFLDDDWEVAGVVGLVILGNEEMRILTLPVKAHKDTEYASKEGTFKSFTDLKKGMLVEVEGTYLKDGKLLAKEIEDETAKMLLEPDLSNEISVKGRVEDVNAMKSTVKVMGITFKLTDLTKGKSTIR